MGKKQQGPYIEYVALDEVRKWERNPRTHDDAAIERSLRAYGFVNPPILDENTGKLVAGHGRIGALETMYAAGEEPPARIEIRAGGKWFVPVVRGIAFKSAAEAEAYLVADNRITEVGGWDMDSLRDIVTNLSDEGLDLEPLGWSQAALDKLLAVEEAKPTRVVPAGSSAGGGDLSGISSTRLLPIYLSAADYQPTVDRMRAVMDAHRLTDYTALLLFLLDQHAVLAAATAPKQDRPGADPFEAE